MIEFTPYFSWSWTLLLIGLLLGLLLLIGLSLFRSSLPRHRKWTKFLLNAWMILLLMAFLMQPFWKSQSPSDPLLVHSGNITPDRLAYLKDSLQAEKSVEISSYKEGGNPLYLIGQDYSWEQLNLLHSESLQWIPEYKEGQLTYIRWQHFVPQGDLQTVKGRIMVTDSADISLQGWGAALAKTTLGYGSQDFELTFPAKILGKNQVELTINGTVIDSLNFFVMPASQLSYQLEFGSPNPEARFLAEFLTKKGNSVHLKVQLSTDMDLIKTTDSSDQPDILITDPSQVHRKDIQDILSSGSNLLLLNLSDPAVDVSRINSLLGTNFNLKRDANLGKKEIEPNLHAWPYHFNNHLSQRKAISGAVAIQHIGSAKVGLSLLESTYPLMLRGDSTAYNRIWEQVLGALAPQEKSFIQIEQPVFIQIPHLVKYTQQEGTNQFLTIAGDTLFLNPSRSNPFRASTHWTPQVEGWQVLNDSLQVYSHGTGWKEIQSLKRITQFIQSSRLPGFYQDDRTGDKINGWVWLGLFLISFGLVWIEPRV